MREIGEEIEELMNEICYDIEVNWFLGIIVFVCYFFKFFFIIYIFSLYYIFNIFMYMYKYVYVESFWFVDFYCY